MAIYMVPEILSSPAHVFIVPLFNENCKSITLWFAMSDSCLFCVLRTSWVSVLSLIVLASCCEVLHLCYKIKIHLDWKKKYYHQLVSEQVSSQIHKYICLTSVLRTATWFHLVEIYKKNQISCIFQLRDNWEREIRKLAPVFSKSGFTNTQSQA